MSPYRYPLSSTTLGEEEAEAAKRMILLGRTTMGQVTEALEDSFAGFVGAQHAVMVNSGSSADLLIALALRPTAVIIPAVTWPTHIGSFLLAGSKVTLCDVDGVNTTGELIEKVMTRETDHVSVPHLMGIPVSPLSLRTGPLRSLGLSEDCCEALGATYGGIHVGSMGLASSFSFFFSHHMTTMEGGMVVTNDGNVAEQLRILRAHGWARQMAEPPPGVDPRYTFVDWGLNVRPTEVQAAIGLVQLRKLPEMLAARQAQHIRFIMAFKPDREIYHVPTPPACVPSWFGIPLFAKHRDSLAAWLEGNGVETRPILAGNIQRQPVGRLLTRSFTPGADWVHDHGLYVGLHSDPRYDAEEVAVLINEWSQR